MEIISRKIRVQEMGGKGVGVIATGDIAVGEVIFREKPIMIIPTWTEEAVAKAFQVFIIIRLDVYDALRSALHHI